MEKKYTINATLCVVSLWEEGFFRSGRSLQDASRGITEKWGHNLSPADISKALTGASFLRRTGKARSFRYIQKTSPVSKKIESIEEQLFSDDLIGKLGKSFKADLEDLRINFGRSGNCTAFVLRKILEKTIYIVFAKHGLGAKLEDKGNNGRLLGLGAMIDVATREKIDGTPFLLSNTAEKVKAIKFLGDTSAHSPLTNVDMETILPQMPFIITAYKELAERL